MKAFANDKQGAVTLHCTPADYNQALEQLRRELATGSTIFVNRNYQGHMNYDVSTPHVDGLLAALNYNQNQVAVESSGQTTKYELEFVQKMREMVGYNHASWGYVSSGGTASNIEALWVARDKARAKGSEARIVLASRSSHYSVKKACKVLDLVYQQCDVDPTTGSIVLPPSLVGVLAVVVNVGTTEAGIVDNIDAVLKAAHVPGHEIFVHADAAYGGYYLYLLRDSNNASELSAYTWRQLQQVRNCDSIAVDPHKLGYSPYGAGVFLLKDGNDRRFINCTAGVNYIDSHVSSESTLEGSRSGSVITSVYFGHKQLEPLYPSIMKWLVLGARRLKTELANAGFIVREPTDLGIVFFRSPFGTEIPMEYYAARFCDPSNVQRNRVQLVTNELVNLGKYFRVVVMDPNFPDYCLDFVKKLKAEFDEYTADFDRFIHARFTSMRAIAEECDLESELMALLRSCRKFTAYNGFEPSGRIHIAQALVTVMNTNTIIDNGGRMIIYIADWFAQLNHKMGGDLAKIQEVGRYFIEVFKSCGINLVDTKFVWASEFINGNPGYLPRVLDISTRNTVKRITRCSQIMGRKEGDDLSASHLIYPCMQCADVFELGVEICQLGVDQRKVNMLAREYADEKKLRPPIILSHHMLMGLRGPDVKMSKSDPSGAIFVEDSPLEVQQKMAKAFCNDSTVGNPVFEYIQYIILRWFGKLTLCGKDYSDIAAIQADFPTMDKKQLKAEVAQYINTILDPVRRHFENPVLRDLAERVASYRITK